MYGIEQPKVAIGGLGGSGTRMVAEIFKRLGLLIDDDLNPSLDWLPFTRIKHQPCCEWISGLRGLRPNNDVFKEPHAIQLIEPIFKVWPDIKFIHVVRHGLEWAYGSEHWQYKDFAAPLNSKMFPREMTPVSRFEYWCYIQRVMKNYATIYPVYTLNYNAMIEEPQKEIGGLLDFAEVEAVGADSELGIDILNIPKRPVSWKCHKKEDLSWFTQEHEEELRRHGFER